MFGRPTVGLPLILAWAFVLCAAAFSFAAPLEGELATYTQPDGQTFHVQLWGDEFFAYQQTRDGHLVLRDPDSNFFCYARPDEDGLRLVSTGVRVGDTPPHTLKPFARLRPGAAHLQSLTFRKQLGVDTDGRLDPYIRKALQASVLSHAKALRIPHAPPLFSTTGARVGLVLLAAFPDRPEDVTMSRAQIDAYCNDPDYADFNNATSVYGYFLIQSGGKLRYNNIVTTYFTAAHPRDYYTDPAINYGQRSDELVIEGLQALQAQGFDFSQCDADGNSLIDGVNLYYAGSRVNSWGEGLWPHKSGHVWNGFSAHSLFTFFQYQITDIKSTPRLATFCHENGHMLCDFPDLYDYNGNAARVGRYSLMATAGTTHPVNVDPYLKIHAGWSETIDLTARSHRRCAVQVDGNTVVQYTNPSNTAEHLIFEVRDNSGYEGVYGGSTVTANPTRGLVAYHALETGKNPRSSIFTEHNPTNSYQTPYELLILEAAPSATVVPWYDDPTPGSNDGLHADGVDALSESTVPALTFWDSTGRNLDSGLRVHTISQRGRTMTFIAGSGSVTGAPTVACTAASLELRADLGTNASAHAFGVYNLYSGTLLYGITNSADWISTSISTGSVSNECDWVDVTFDTSSLAAGDYAAHIRIFDALDTNATAVLIPVTLKVHSAPVMTFTPSSISTSICTGNHFRTFIEIRNSGESLLRYTLAESIDWLQLDATEGSVGLGADRIAVSITNFSVSGVYTGLITLTPLNSLHPPTLVEVSVTVTGNVEALPLLQLDPADIDLGCVRTLTSTQATFYLRNLGGGALTGEVAVLAPVSVVSGSNYAILTGTTHSVTLALTPQTDGVQSNTVYFSGGGGATGTLRARALGDLDSDGDGAGDWQEYVAGTAWTNIADVFKITEVARNATNRKWTLYWPSVSGHRYTVYANTNTLTGSWTNLHESVGSGALMVYTNSLDRARPAYFRLGVQRPH